VAERAWDAGTVGLAWAPERWFDLVEAFVAETRPKNPELTCSGLLLALDNARGWDQFVEGGWVSLVTVHVYVYGDVPGLGGVRVLGVVEKFVRWLRAHDLLHAWDERRLLAEIDQARLAVGAKAKGTAPAHDRCYRADQLDALASEFHAAGSKELPESLVRAIVRLGGSAARLEGTELVRFGALDPYELPLLMSDAAQADNQDPIDAQIFDRMVYAVLYGFYQWLADAGRLERERAEEIARVLAKLVIITPVMQSTEPS
jgi:hypothetical protein